MSDQTRDEVLGDLVAASDRIILLASKLVERTAIAERVDSELSRQQERTRMLLWGVTFGLVLDVLITVVGGGLFIGSFHRIGANTDRLSHLQDVVNEKVFCAQNNFWGDILKQSRQQPGQTPTQKAQAARFQRLIDESNKVLDCERFATP